MSKEKSKSRITIFQISIMTIITIAGLRGLPAMAIMGWSSIILYLVPAALFFIPTAMVSAELGATYEGGIYEWVREGLGKRWGLVAVWMQWGHNIVWYPAQLAFIGAAAASVVGLRDLADSGLYIATVIVIVFWAGVWLTLKGGNLFAKVATVAGLIGVIIPTILLLLLGLFWIITGQKISPTLTASKPIPNFLDFAAIALVVQNFLAFAGMEVNAVHAQHLDNPKKYTKVVGIAFVGALTIFILPTLVLSMVLPKDVNLSEGAVIAFQTMFEQFHMGFMGNVMALAIVFGAVASLISWLSGPSRGILNAARDGALPGFFHKTNKNDAQSGVLYLMGVVVTLLATLYIIFPKSVSMVFSMLIGMAVAQYVCMYFLMFIAAIKLRREGKTGKDGYRAPALTFFCSLGIIATLVAFLMTFIPSSSQQGIPPVVYSVLVGVVFLILAVSSLVLYQMAQKEKLK